MTISYNWLHSYLPETIEPERLSKILTSIGLEVESLEKYESIKGGLQSLIIGEVIECNQHPNADKLKLTKVNIGTTEPLQIVCGAPNVAMGQKVIVATVGTTIYPVSGEPLTMKVAKIRGVESYGMICAEDEIGLSSNHAGIIILPNDVVVGTNANDYFKPYSDFIYEIGLTPNRMDAMSHLGVAKDVCAYLSHHNKKEEKTKLPFDNSFKVDEQTLNINVTVEAADACPRFSGLTISNITIAESPQWLKNKLTAIGVRSINNVVDITNFILHETGQPLHAYNAEAVIGNHIIVKKLPEGTTFTTLDDKERRLNAFDLMICNGNEEPMCIGGVFGGLKSGVSNNTKNIFLESACFNATNIRKTSVAHGLRTDAATRFEKGVDIANCVNVLKRAALLIKEIAGGTISSDVVDVYPSPKEKTQVALKYHYLKKLSGKNYHPDTVKRILLALGFEVVKESIDELTIAVPYSKPDISLPADIVEEIIRIDGLDNIDIPTSITISPSVETLNAKETLREKIANYLTGLGFNEIFTNSITNSKYYTDEVLNTTVKMINNLSEELNVMRPSILETGLETIAYNINRKNSNLKFFEFGKTYSTTITGKYAEKEHLALYLTGNNHEDEWKEKSNLNDLYTTKGIATAVLQLNGIADIQFVQQENILQITNGKKELGYLKEISKNQLNNFGIKQNVFFIDIDFETLLNTVIKQKIVYKEVAKFPAVERDLAIVIDKAVTYNAVQLIIKKQKLNKLQNTRLFDVFESDKLGTNKKSMAINFTFLDEEKTLTDKEIDAMMNKLIDSFTKELNAEIRK
ncbi:MAG: phenylalanine--tRNA ligase subunit beta [Bacteroidetes bacterium]|nr:phenylalanine--tRNA ligase subunit beta [Bacteroidota bacterium]MBS1670636.1 phenylalanine--tRNA ligase subunit beta [Bacteroidota bacterium]